MKYRRMINTAHKIGVEYFQKQNPTEWTHSINLIIITLKHLNHLDCFEIWIID
jgi:hypothetical protein